MLIKEQVRKAINFDYPENIPQLLNVWYHGGTLEKYGEELKSLIARYPDDIMWHVYADVWLDWGLDVEHIPMENYATVEFIQAKKRPLEDWKKLESFLRNIPDPVKIGMFEGLGKLRQKYYSQYLLYIQLALFKEKLDLFRGMENVYTDLYLNRDKIEVLLEVFFTYAAAVIKKCAEIGVDGILFGDDWGSERSLLISPKMWREVFKPWYKRAFEKVHHHGMDVFFHSDGNIREIIPDLIEIGVDVLHPLQPDVMDIKKIVQDFRGEVCFLTGLDVRFLPKISAQKVKESIYDEFKLFDYKKGGFIIGATNALLPDIPMENLKVMYRAIDTYRKKS